ncbi:hypothetical protein [Tropicibacter naphthalenivorans]|uniref:Sulfotransferase family protein n=1 Tax=Tropicibacter naphthalenivorans TaxID=441103 RepID=A0A0P1G9N8_9RHOB|nr:hypothetical protein [Tropicibacter naphthalenivorans]CUH78288.1 hypothetical protein TRN7648_01899 [Tropicibacter naphthalenivorans]SMC79053.1 hypothetical protein SAMN04488093_10461 [Tropicibacter naphthalenivorans]
MTYPSRIIIHPGFHKTGTSTVQKGLEAGRTALDGHAHVILRDDIPYLTHAAQSFSRRRTDDSLTRFYDRATELFALFDGIPQPVVISAEDLAGVMPGRAGVTSYSATPILMGQMARAARAVLPGAEVVFYLSTRAPEPWMASLWWQHLRSTRIEADYPDYRADAALGADLDAIVAQIRAETQAPVESQPLEALKTAPQGPLTPIYELLNLPDGLRATHKPENARVDLGLEPVFLALNRSGLPDDVVHQTKQKLLRIARRAAQTPPE